MTLSLRYRDVRFSQYNYPTKDEAHIWGIQAGGLKKGKYGKQVTSRQRLERYIVSKTFIWHSEENTASITSPVSTASSVKVATVKTTPSKPSIAKVIA